jgi:hypothetical protein
VQAASGHAPKVLYEQLLEALAHNLLYYDSTYDSAYHRPVSDNVGWLGFTHGITFANAVHNQCTAFPHLWPAGLLQMACFLGRNCRYIDLEMSREEWTVSDTEGFFDDVHELLLDHGMREPIFAAHLIKTTRAVREELATASPSCQRTLLAGLNRFLHAPIKQKHVRRLARQAVALVSRDFQMP